MNIYYAFSIFTGLPVWLRWVLIGLFVAALITLWIIISPVVALMALGGLVLALILVAIFMFFIKRAREKKAAAFGGELRGQSGSAQITDPARRARLEELAKSFEQGLEKFRAVGKNLYDMPWYVIVGEPGAGKTEAIRHSNVGFPPGMQDEFQGVGGTINMNWWFTNQAVILDTAGRLLFEEIEAGQTGEWRVFLEMLRKHRPNCPINGLILAIPSESLIKDTPDQISKKAGKIAQQLEQIQRQLDVRFPAFVVITKCDLLNGFREFFDDMTEPQAQQQMVGWSNPDPLDAPFRPELVDDHIYTVVERLRRRRQGLLLDPMPRHLERRTDEVDRLFSLPHSVSLVAANLQNYLQTIFIAGAWSARPLFLRGIYFTSSLREGSALDQELAQALTLSVDSLPEGRAWERDRSYFLRDVFVEKAFREQGLVTRATDTKKLVLRRRLSLLGFGLVGIIALVALSWLGYTSLQRSIGTQSGYWARAADGWNGNSWEPVVQREENGSGYKYLGDQPVGPGDSPASRMHFKAGDASVTDFHAQLQELSAAPLHVPFVFRPLTHFGVGIDTDRKRAQRVVFEDSAVAPVLEVARQKMISGSPVPKLGSPEAVTEGVALLGLVRLEAGIVNRREHKNIGMFTGEKLLPPLFTYTSGPKFDEPLPKMLDTTYQQTWPPDYLSGGFNLTDNTAVQIGLDRFLKEAQWATQSRSDLLPLIQKLIDEVTKYGKIEDDLASAARTPAPVEKSDKAVFDAFGALEAQRQVVDVAISDAKKAGVFEGGPISLAAAYDRLCRELRLRYDIGRALKAEAESVLELGSIKKALGKLGGGESKDHVIFKEIYDKLSGVMAELEAKFKPALSDTEVARLKTLDELYMADPKTNALQYEARWALYQKAVKATPDITYARSQDLVGQEWKSLTDIFAKVTTIRSSVEGYNGAFHEKAVDICKYALLRAERVHSEEFCKTYLFQARTKLKPELRFPLVWTPMEVTGVMKDKDFIAAVQLVDRIKRDLDSPGFGAIKPNAFVQPLVDFRKKLGLLDPIRDAILTPDRQMRLVTIVLLSKADQFRLSGQSVALDTFKAIELRVGTIDHATPIKQGAVGAIPSTSDKETELGKFTMYEPFHFHFLSSVADRRPLVDMPAPNDWTSIRLLYEMQAQHVGNGKRWQFALQPKPNMRMWFEFRFDAPLPESFEDWPTRATLGF